jgi:electron transport complex protein RnfC
VHPPQRKTFSGDAAIEIVPTPDKVVLPLLQHIGGPCTPVVKPKQEVVFGDMVGKGEAFVSASLHSPVNGIVQKMAVATLANGGHVQAIAIRSLIVNGWSVSPGRYQLFPGLYPGPLQ